MHTNKYRHEGYSITNPFTPNHRADITSSPIFCLFVLIYGDNKRRQIPHNNFQAFSDLNYNLIKEQYRECTLNLNIMNIFIQLWLFQFQY